MCFSEHSEILTVPDRPALQSQALRQCSLLLFTACLHLLFPTKYIRFYLKCFF